MASIRLNMTHRELLRGFAKKNIETPAEQKAFDKTYAKALAAVRRDAEKQFPAADMAILAKYHLTERLLWIQGGAPDGRNVVFKLQDQDDCPPFPDGHARRLSFSQASVEAVDAFQKASAELDKARNAKLEHYRALIAASRTYEELLDIWPAASALHERIGAPSTAMVALSDDVRKFIKRDNAGADLQAAA